jgi:hypothetical protein
MLKFPPRQTKVLKQITERRSIELFDALYGLYLFREDDHSIHVARELIADIINSVKTISPSTADLDAI